MRVGYKMFVDYKIIISALPSYGPESRSVNIAECKQVRIVPERVKLYLYCINNYRISNDFIYSGKTVPANNRVSIHIRNFRYLGRTVIQVRRLYLSSGLNID